MFWAAREVGFGVQPSRRGNAAARFSACSVPKLVLNNKGTDIDNNDNDAAQQQQQQYTTTNPDEIFGLVFQNWIATFIAVYENTARAFTRHEALWSADERNVKEYLKSAENHEDDDNFAFALSSSSSSSLPFMKDVLNVPYSTAIRNVPQHDLITDQDLFSVTVVETD